MYSKVFGLPSRRLVDSMIEYNRLNETLLELEKLRAGAANAIQLRVCSAGFVAKDLYKNATEHHCVSQDRQRLTKAPVMVVNIYIMFSGTRA